MRPRPLSEAAALLGVPAPAGSAGALVTGVTLDSRRVVAGDLYAALPGARVHGARFAADVTAAGAVAILTDPAGEAEARRAGLPVLVVDDPRGRLGSLAAWVYDEPARALRTVGVTGTNGKTTTAYLVEAGMRAAGLTTGLVGTVETRVAGHTVPSVRTTPESTDLQALLALMRERGVDALAMEVSSHALVLGRVDGVVYDVAVFTNLGSDHLDFHADLEDYFRAKASLFTTGRARHGVVWTDDPYGRRLAAMAADAGLPVTTVGSDDADVVVTRTSTDPTGRQRLRLSGAVAVEAEILLPGAFNVANAALALTALDRLGVDVSAAARGLAACRVPGRMEPVDAGQDFLAVVDFAHTPDAVETALTALRERTPGRLLAVLGCGGDRDRAKRPVMGEVAARVADVLVITDDNPRSEEPTAIRAAVEQGALGVPESERAEIHTMGDRAAAIAKAVGLAGAGDTVAVLGKGHEQGQELAGIVQPFDDRTVLGEAIAAVRR